MSDRARYPLVAVRRSAWLLALVGAAACTPPAASSAEGPATTVSIPSAPLETSSGPRSSRGGGLRLVYGVVQAGSAAPAAEVMRHRLARWGVDAEVKPRGDEIVVELRSPLSFEQRQSLSRPGRLEIRRCDDDRDPLAGMSPSTLPDGIALETENVSLGPGQYGTRHFVKVSRDPSEPPTAARQRLEAWLHRTFPGTPMALAGLVDTGGSIVGFRSYLLHAEVDLDNHAVASAEPQEDRTLGGGIALPLVAVRLTDAGRDAFAQLTAAHQHRRLAILVDGLVATAPIVQSTISGGRVQISLGHGASIDDAKALASLLADEPLPATVELQSEELFHD